MAASLFRKEAGDVTDATGFLVAYDQQLHTDAETPSAIAVTRVGYIRLVRFANGRGFVAYPRLSGSEAANVSQRVGQTLDHYRHDPEITRIEWRTRGHDQIPGLHESLLDHGFTAQESGSIMIGRTQSLIADMPLPDDVTLSQVSDEDDIGPWLWCKSRVAGRTCPSPLPSNRT